MQIITTIFFFIGIFIVQGSTILRRSGQHQGILQGLGECDANKRCPTESKKFCCAENTANGGTHKCCAKSCTSTKAANDECKLNTKTFASGDYQAPASAPNQAASNTGPSQQSSQPRFDCSVKNTPLGVGKQCQLNHYCCRMGPAPHESRCCKKGPNQQCGNQKWLEKQNGPKTCKDYPQRYRPGEAQEDGEESPIERMKKAFERAWKKEFNDNRKRDGKNFLDALVWTAGNPVTGRNLWMDECFEKLKTYFNSEILGLSSVAQPSWDAICDKFKYGREHDQMFAWTNPPDGLVDFVSTTMGKDPCKEALAAFFAPPPSEVKKKT